LAGFKGILHIAVLLLSAKLFEEIAVRLTQLPIVGYIIAGIVVGLALLALVAACRRTHAFYTDSYTDGIFFLFFLIGLEEMDILSIFSVLRKRLFAGATVRFVVPFAPGPNATLAISGLPTATTVTAPAPRQEDLSLTFEQLSFARMFVCMVIFFSAVTLFRLKILPHVMRYVRSHFKIREIYFGMFIGLILLMSYFAEASGVHRAVGALCLACSFPRCQRRTMKSR
jgi:Kef-type K+ transport system membrane component KefB